MIRRGSDPPEDQDFWNAIQEFAERHGAVLPRFGGESEVTQRFMDSLESFKTEQKLASSRSAIKSPSEESRLQIKQVKCRHCGDPFVPQRGQRTRYIDECPACLHDITSPLRRTVKERLVDASLGNTGQSVNVDVDDKGKSSKVSANLARVLELFARKFKRRI